MSPTDGFNAILLLQAIVENGDNLLNLEKIGLNDEKIRTRLSEFMEYRISVSKKILEDPKLDFEGALKEKSIKAWELVQRKIMQRATPSNLNKK
jgi:hypothetical protein